MNETNQTVSIMRIGTKIEVYSDRQDAEDAADGINEVHNFGSLTAEVKDYEVDSGDGYCTVTGDVV